MKHIKNICLVVILLFSMGTTVQAANPSVEISKEGLVTVSGLGNNIAGVEVQLTLEQGEFAENAFDPENKETYTFDHVKKQTITIYSTSSKDLVVDGNIVLGKVSQDKSAVYKNQANVILVDFTYQKIDLGKIQVNSKIQVESEEEPEGGGLPGDGETDDGTTDDGTTDDGTTDDGTTDDGTTDDGTTDDGTTDDGTTDDGTTDDGTSDSETSNDGTSDSETSNDGTTNNETSNDETTDNETQNDGTTNNETSNDESTGEDSSLAAPTIIGPVITLPETTIPPSVSTNTNSTIASNSLSNYYSEDKSSSNQDKISSKSNKDKKEDEEDQEDEEDEEDESDELLEVGNEVIENQDNNSTQVNGSSSTGTSNEALAIEEEKESNWLIILGLMASVIAIIGGFIFVNNKNKISLEEINRNYKEKQEKLDQEKLDQEQK